MVLTAEQIQSFFEDDDQMGLDHDTVVKLEDEGIILVEDLRDNDKDMIKDIAESLHKPAECITDPNDATPSCNSPTFSVRNPNADLPKGERCYASTRQLVGK